MAEFDCAQEKMTQSIAGDPLLAAPAQNQPPDVSVYRSRYLEHQRAMESRISALRASVRAALSATSAELASLAALDAVMDKTLGARERQLLTRLPGLLVRHYTRSCTAETHPLRPSAFGRQMQAVLLAELEVRLQPVAGMIEALAAGARTNQATPLPAASPRRATAQK